jgi:hypothetical protein
MSRVKIIKYGAAATLGGVIGASYAAHEGTPLGGKTDAAKYAAKVALGSGIIATSLVLGRGHIVAGAKGAARAMAGKSVGDLKTVFRRVRGRIIPIRVKR